MPTESHEKLARFFARDLCQKATAPLRNGVEVAVEVTGEGTLHLLKAEDRVAVQPGAAKKPDITVMIPPAAIDELDRAVAEDVGDIGIAIVKLMADQDPLRRVRAKVHIGLFEMLRNGYFGILPLGGPKVMKFLASKGVGGIGKVKDAISKMRE